MPAAAGFEESDLLVVLAARLFAAGELEGVGDVGIGDQPGGERLGDVAGMGGSGEARVDEDARSGATAASSASRISSR